MLAQDKRRNSKPNHRQGRREVGTSIQTTSIQIQARALHFPPIRLVKVLRIATSYSALVRVWENWLSQVWLWGVLDYNSKNKMSPY